MQQEHKMWETLFYDTIFPLHLEISFKIVFSDCEVKILKF